MWKDIKGFEGFYQVSDKGEIRSLDRYVMFKYKEKFYKGAIKRQQIGTNGYRIVKMYKGDKKQYTFSVHRLVAETFLNKPSYAECVNHIDGNKLNNNVNNLEWCTYSHNNKEAWRLGLNKSNPELISKLKGIKVVMFNENGIMAIKDTSKEMAIHIKEKYNIDSNIDTIARSIRKVCKNNEIGYQNIKSTHRRKTVYGYKFNYLKDYS
jgi:hypothetical protein